MTFRYRRTVAALSASVVAAGLAVASAPSADADYSKGITIVGTSDVFDSGLMQYLLPKYQAATGATYNYVSKGTGDAIAYAEAGTASVLLVHAASLENQFVSQGYSLEKYGRSAFWGDYVLIGPKNADPAGVVANDPHDIVGAFERIAAAGAAGNAQFISRGNTAGTPVQEHQLWALSGSQVGKCAITDANGGGQVPSTGTGSCNTAAGSGGSLPSWYTKTGVTQGPNIIQASTCTAGPDKCYVFADRGTFQYLQSIGQAQNLRIMVRNNAPTARSGQAGLINAFHAYAINGKTVPAGNAVSRSGALKFLNWLTSPAGQKAVGSYLSADSPFIPAAAPTISVGQVRTRVHKHALLKFKGRVANAVPGYPALARKRIFLQAVTGYGKHKKVRTVAKGKTTRYGFYALRYRPTKSARYYVTVKPSARVENGALSPVFGDLLAAGVSQTFPVRVTR